MCGSAKVGQEMLGHGDLDQSSLVSGRGETLAHVVEERPGERKWGEDRQLHCHWERTQAVGGRAEGPP